MVNPMNSGMDATRYPSAAVGGPLGPQTAFAGPYGGPAGVPGTAAQVGAGFGGMARPYGGSPAAGPAGPNGPRFNQHKPADAGNQPFLQSGQAKRPRRC